ncbi:hypothetical protein SCD_n03045 (plasmid) [Sulfuricella denitrificans skB26]|uniref:Uncharacterized protein n=1 Tax=Sulfuricella denitrificans (strain DSM 22764 / NBRC 105220 / skB26) TaxID=1163617 RepID=S6API6_SULDS|nr:hypothetical protein [Sulfuricella denitrificans]BAN36844.1 hypothetical protein SCD_n03045 [Sulfuricella denitrificans skB26]
MHTHVLSLNLTGKPEEIIEGNSLQNLAYEVAMRFASTCPETTPLPFTAHVNPRGTIIRMELKADLGNDWWQDNHPLLDGSCGVLTAVIEPIKKRSERYLIPENLLKGGGKAWLLINDGQVTDLVYATKQSVSANDPDFKARLKQRGKLIKGKVSGVFFFPDKEQ